MAHAWKESGMSTSSVKSVFFPRYPPPSCTGEGGMLRDAPELSTQIQHPAPVLLPGTACDHGNVPKHRTPSA